MALLAIARPKAPATNRNSTCCSCVKPNVLIAEVKTPGKHPAEPAVGVAQIRPIWALTSFTATASRAAPKIISPDKAFPD